MKRKYFILTLALMIFACSKEDGMEPERPDIAKEFINVPPNMQLLGDGQVAELRIEANCSWTISNTEEWLTVTPMSGVNSQSVTVSAGKNSTGKERTAILKVKANTAPERSVMVTQPKSGTNDSNTQREPNPDDNQPPT